MHIPVLLKEVIQYLDPKSNENFIDATIGRGGHAREILKHNGPRGKILGIDWDAESLKQLDSGLKIEDLRDRFILVQGNFANIGSIVRDTEFGPVQGILFDLGLSSWQLEKSGRGFSFLRDEPLDMRFSTGRRAADIVNTYPTEELERMLWEYGEERFARRIAQGIVRARRSRRIERTTELVNIVMRAIPPPRRRSRIHPATRTFQALRIEVNDELSNIKKALVGAHNALEARGRIVVISFHSLEDRIVKNFFREKQKFEELSILTKKPITPSEEEVTQNPRARSAKLRAAIKI